MAEEAEGLTGVGFYIEGWEETRETRGTREKKLIFLWL